MDTPAAVAPALEWLSDLPVIGVDVERADSKRYYRAAALLQVGGDGRVVLLDPLALEDFDALQRFVADRTVVLHACENDLDPLATLGIEPTDVADTAIAAMLLGLPTGLDQLLADVLDVVSGHDKARMQRADWERRPLPADMAAYAAEDVAHLPALWAQLDTRLRAAGRRGWYDEELAAVLARPPVEDRRDWTRTKGIGRLDPQVRARVRALWEAREELARDTDTAPGRIVNDRVLVDLAQRPPAATTELGRRGVRRQAVREFGQHLVAALDAAEDAPGEPSRRDGRRVTDQDRELADRLRVIRSEVADRLGIDAGVLCPNRQLLRAVLTDPATPQELREALELRDWQWQAVAERFIAAVFGDMSGNRDG